MVIGGSGLEMTPDSAKGRYRRDPERYDLTSFSLFIRGLLKPSYTLYSISFRDHPSSQREGHAVVSAKNQEQAEVLLEHEVESVSGFYRDLETNVQETKYTSRKKGIVALFMP